MRKIRLISAIILLTLSGCFKQIPAENPYTVNLPGQLPAGRYEINHDPYYGVGYVFDLADDAAFAGVDVYIVHSEMELALLMAIHIDDLAKDLYYVEARDLDYDKMWLYLDALLVNEVDIQPGTVEVLDSHPKATYYTYTFTYDFSAIAKVENTIDAWTYDLKTSFYTDHQKAEESLKTLLDNVRYDDAALNDKTRSDDAFTALGVFQDGLAVCNGYSQAYMGLLKDLDVPAIMVSSDKDDHAWNMVYVDDQWSYVDSTWEDNTYATSDYWYYFLIDEKTLDNDHRWDSGAGATLNAQDFDQFADYVFPQTKAAQ